LGRCQGDRGGGLEEVASIRHAPMVYRRGVLVQR
jgi:hypothetical protein